MFKKQNKNSSIKAKDGQKKKKFKMPQAVTILLIIIMFLIFLTWVVPAGVFGWEIDTSGQLAVNEHFYQTGALPFGILDLFFVVGEGFVDAADLIVFLLAMGALLEVIMRTKSMEAGVGGVIKKLNGKEIFVIPILMILLGIGGTTFGMAEETVGFYPLLVPLFVLVGFDAMTGVFTILLGAGVGVLASTVNPFSIGAAVGAIDGNVGIGDGMGFRWLLFIIVEGLAIAFVIWYARKVKNNPEKSSLPQQVRENHLSEAKASYHLEDLPKFTTKRKVTLSLLGLGIFLMILGVMPWGDWLGTDSDLGNINGSAPWITKLIPGFGYWWFLELAFIFFLLFIAAGLINGMPESEIVDAGKTGAKDMLGVGIVIGFSRGAKIVMTGGEMEVMISIINADVDGAGVWAVDSIVGPNSSWETTIRTFLESTGTVDGNLDALARAGGFEIVEKTFTDSETGLIAQTLTIVDKWEESMANTLLNGMSDLGTIDKAGLGPISFLIHIPLSFLIPSTSGLAGLSMPILGNIPGFGTEEQAAIITGYSAASGIVNLVTPTSGVVMGGLALAKVDYDKYLKAVAPFIGILFVIVIAILPMAYMF